MSSYESDPHFYARSMAAVCMGVGYIGMSVVGIGTLASDSGDLIGAKVAAYVATYSEGPGGDAHRAETVAAIEYQNDQLIGHTLLIAGGLIAGSWLTRKGWRQLQNGPPLPERSQSRHQAHIARHYHTTPDVQK